MLNFLIPRTLICLIFATTLFANSLTAQSTSTSSTQKSQVVITGELKKWHKITLTFDGPETSESDKLNPFMNYRFNVVFTHKESGKILKVPGYFVFLPAFLLPMLSLQK